MIKINDITIDYHSLLAKEDDSYYTDEKRPVIGDGLTYAECRHDCPYGEIRVRWEKCGEDTYRLKVHVPIGTDCQIELPNRKTDIVENGNYEFTWKE